MQNPQTSPPIWQKLLVAAGFIALAALYAIWVWGDTLTDLGGDSATYLIISRLYSPYHAASASVIAFKSGIISPPMFPLILAVVDGGYHFLAAHLAVAFFAVASVAALYFWLREESLNLWLSAGTALAFAILPATMLTAFNIWTEYPFLFFSLAAIAVVARTARPDSSSTRAWYIAALLVACATLTRVAALPLLGAFLLYVLLKRPRRFIWIALVSLLPFAVWEAYSSFTEIGAGSYVNHIAHVYSANPFGTLIAQLQTEYHAIFDAWQGGWIGPTYMEVLRQLVTGGWFLCIIGWLYRLSLLKFDAIYTLLYVILLFLWPHAEEASRYSFVLYPVLIANGVQLFVALSRLIPQTRLRTALPSLVVCLMLICALPATLLNLKRFTTDVPDNIAFAKHSQLWYGDSQFGVWGYANYISRLFKQLGEIDRFVAPGECVFAIKPSVITLYTDRISAGPPPVAASDAKFNEDLKKCRYAYVMPFVSPTFGEMFYPMNRLKGRMKVLSKINDGRGQLDGALLEIQQ